MDVVGGDSIKSQLYQEGLILTLEMSMGIVDDGVGGPPPPNMAPWHIEYFKLKEFEKIAEAGRSL